MGTKQLPDEQLAYCCKKLRAVQEENVRYRILSTELVWEACKTRYNTYDQGRFAVKELFGQFLRFAGVGTVSFFIDYATMVLLTEVFGVPYLVSTTVGFIVSVVFNYLASMRFVFTHKEEMSRKREFAIFVALSAVGLGLNDVLMWVGTSAVGIDYRITKVIATAVVTLYNFVSRKLLLDAR